MSHSEDEGTSRKTSRKDLQVAKERRKKESRHKERKHIERSSTSDSSSDNSDDSDRARKKKKRESKDKAKRKKERRKKKREKKEKKRKRRKAREDEKAAVKSTDKCTTTNTDRTQEPQPGSEAVPKKRSMVPMTKEEYEKQQAQVRRVLDPETGRHRLIKGTGEVLEEIVSRDRHKAINKTATQGDGAFFQANLGLRDK